MGGNVEKLIQKSKLNFAYQKLESLELREEVKEEYMRLLTVNDLSNRMLAQHLRSSILPAVAFHIVLTRNGWTKIESVDYIRISILEAARPMADFFQKAGKIPFFYTIFRLMCPLSVKMGFGDAGWDFTWNRNDRVSIEWVCTRCFYVDVLKKYEMIELAPAFCESDDVVYGHIPGICWKRTKTIGRNDTICDFKFYCENGFLDIQQ